MPQGLNVSSIVAGALEWRDPAGNKYPVTIVTLDDTDPNSVPIGIRLATSVTLTSDNNGDWYPWTVSSGPQILDLDGAPIPYDTRIDAAKQTVSIPVAPPTNQPPTIQYLGTALADITAAGTYDFAVTLTVVDPA